MRHRVDPTVRERSSHLGKVLGIHVDGALLGIKAGCLVRIGLDALVGIHQLSNSLIALIGVRFLLVDLLIH